MLILGRKKGEGVRLRDTKSGKHLGIVMFNGMRRSDNKEALIGFEFPQHIEILRDELHGGDAENDNKK